MLRIKPANILPAFLRMTGLRRESLVVSAILTFLVCLWTPLSGQTDDGSGAVPDSSRLPLINSQAAEELRNANPDAAIQRAEEALELAAKTGNREWMAYGSMIIARAYEEKNEIASAIRHYLRAINSFEELQDSTSLAEAFVEVGVLYEGLNAREKALDYFLDAFRLQRGLNDTQAQTSSLLHVGQLQAQLEQYDEALQSFEQARGLQYRAADTLAVISTLRRMIGVNTQRNNYDAALALNLEILEINRERNDIEAIAASLNNIGYMYSLLGDHIQALQYYKQTLLADEELGTNPSTHINLGITYQNLGDYEGSVEHLKKALLHWDERGNSERSSHVLNLLGLVYLKNGDLYNAESYVLRSIEAARRAGSQTGLMESFKSYAEILQRSGDFEDALEHFQRHQAIRDSLYLEERLREQALMQKQYDIEKTEEELKLFFADEAVKDLQLTQLRLQSEKKDRENELLRREQLLRDAALKQEELEKERTVQALLIARQQLEQQKRKRELTDLRQREELQRMALQQNEMQELERQRTIKLLESEKKLLEKDKQFRETLLDRNRIVTMVTFAALALAVVILVLVLVGFWQKRKDNKKLARQKEDIEHKNHELEHLNHEIAAQRDAVADSYRQLDLTHSQLKTAQSQLVDSEKMASLGQLTAGIAHEINNPINFVSSNVNPLKTDFNELRELMERYLTLHNSPNPEQDLQQIARLRDELDPEFLFKEINDLLNGVEEGAVRTRDIVAGLRNFSRLDESDFKVANINEGIESTLVLLHNKIKHSIEVHRNYGDIPDIECLPGKLNQVFMNILGNAIQAMDGKGELFISTSLVGDKIRLSFRDTGVGMTEEVRKHIFEPFYTTKSVGEGTGLGLSISFGIIETHKGSIEVESEVGKGTEMIIYLPVHSAASQESDKRDSVSQESASQA